MSCMCTDKLKTLLEKLTALPTPVFALPLPLKALASIPLGGGGPSTSAMSLAGANLPPLPLSPITLSQLSSVASFTTSIQAGLGIDLTSQEGESQLSSAISTVNANMAAFLPMASLDAAPYADLSLLGSLTLGVGQAYDVDLLSPSGAAGLNAALNAQAAVPMPPLPPNANAYASLAASATAFGIDPVSPGAMEALAVKAGAVASMTIPTLSFSPSLLLNPLALLASLESISAGLGLDPFDPGFGPAVGDLNAAMPGLAGVTIPASLSAGAATAAGASSIDGIDLSGMSAIEPSALINFQAPNFGPLSALASFSMQAASAGFPVASTSACGSACPMFA